MSGIVTNGIRGENQQTAWLIPETIETYCQLIEHCHYLSSFNRASALNSG